MKSLTSCLLAAIPLSANAETRLDPTLHLTAVTGVSSAHEISDIARHGHDPNGDLALQGLDVGLSLRHDDWLSAFINLNAFTLPGGSLDAEWEEGFVKFSQLPGNFEIRAGRYLNRFGLQNNQHLHSWNFVNSNLSTPRFLGEEGLFTEGFELTWIHDTDRSLFALSASYGNSISHDDHGHDEGHEDEQHEEEREDGHDHAGLEEALFAEEFASVRAQLAFNANDFHQHRFGLNGAWGRNGFGNGRDTALYSADYSYQWRENGFEAGGREFSTGLEVFHRDVEWADDEGASGADSQSGFLVFGRYRFAEPWIADLRYEDLQGRETSGEIELGGDHRRLSLALTRECTLAKWDSYARLQYSHDDLESASEDTVWLQFGFNFGDGEVR